MPTRNAAFSFAAVTFLAAPAMAQETTDAATSNASADLLLMREKAAANPYLSQQFQQIELRYGHRAIANPEGTLRQYVFWFPGGNDIPLREPVRIATIEALQPAQIRATVAQKILVADLDGDWQVTRDELAETLKYIRADAAAAAFSTGDRDGNDVLTTEEIKAAAGAYTSSLVGQGRQMPSMMTVFDFDADGSISEAEFNRGEAALAN